MTHEQETMLEALRSSGLAVVVITAQDIQSCTPHDDDCEPTVSLEDAQAWLNRHKDDVEEALLGDYWSETIYALFSHHPIGCPNDDAGKHTPNEHGQCDDCREWVS